MVERTPSPTAGEKLRRLRTRPSPEHSGHGGRFSLMGPGPPSVASVALCRERMRARRTPVAQQARSGSASGELPRVRV